jgi:large subunit ribosomal protein L17
MRHRRAGRKLGRNATHRLALFRNLSRELIQHERIITTVEKAKELRPFVERLVTLAKKGTLHARRQALSRLGPMGNAEVLDKKGESTGQTVLQKLFSEFGPRFADRPGGYTRVVKRHERRLGDAGFTAIIEFLKAGETKVQRRRGPAPAAPAPVVAPQAPAPVAEAPAPENAPPAEPTPPAAS